MSAETENTARRTDRPKTLILWGLGGAFRRHLSKIRDLEARGLICIAGVTAKSARPCNWPFTSPAEAARAKADYILILSDYYEDEILRDALALGIPRSRILAGHIFDLPRFDFSSYINLKESRLSVVSNDCFGGFLSNRLSFEHLSPFKNLYLLDGDYLKCLGDLKHYCLEADPVFARFQEGNEQDEFERYPVLRIDDIEVYCNHDSDPDKAIETWCRRRKKMNFDNLFVTMRTRKKESEEAFSELSAYPRRICFVPFETDLPCSVQVQGPADPVGWAAASLLAAREGPVFEDVVLPLLGIRAE